MRIAILSDIHGNLEALEAVIQDTHTKVCDHLVCLGDIVGYGADPDACVDLIREKVWNDGEGEMVVKGNHDDAASGGDDSYFNRDAQRAVRWTHDRLSRENLRWLAELPYERRISTEALLVHSSPVEPPQWFYVVSMAEAFKAFEHFTETACFIGHSHVPFHVAMKASNEEILVEPMESIHIREGYRYLSNVGSVGQPRDGDPRASYVVLDIEQRTIDRYRVVYDSENAARKIREAGLPEFLADRLLRGR